VANLLYTDDFAVQALAGGVLGVAISVGDCTCDGVSVSRVSAGLYDITMPKTFKTLRRCNLGYLSATEADSKPQIVSYTASTGVLRMCLNTGATRTDPTYVSTSKVFFCCVFKRS